VHRIHEEPAFTDVVTLFARLRDDSVNVGPHYAGDDPRFRSVAHLEQHVDGLFTEVDAVSLNVVVVEVHVGSLYACEAADDGVVEDTEIPVVTDRTFVDANDVPVEVDILSVATTDTREGTNKADVASHFVPVVTDSIKEGTAKICVETTNRSLETTRVCPVTAPFGSRQPLFA